MSDSTPPGQPPRPPDGSGTPPPPPPPPPGGTPPGDSGGWGPPPGGPGDQGGNSGWGGAPPPPPGGPAGPEGYSVGDAFSYSFEKFKANWAMLVLIALVVIVGVGVVQLLSQLVTNAVDGVALLFVVGLVMSIATTLAQWLLQAGIIKGALDLTRNRTLTLGSAFSGWDFGQVIIGSLLVAVATFVGFILLFIPGLIVIFLTWFTIPYIVDHKMGAIDAIKASVKLVSSNVGPMLLLALGCVAAGIVGAVLCGVGLLVAIPIIVLAQVYTFRTLNGDPVQA